MVTVKMGQIQEIYIPGLHSSLCQSFFKQALLGAEAGIEKYRPVIGLYKKCTHGRRYPFLNGQSGHKAVRHIAEQLKRHQFFPGIVLNPGKFHIAVPIIAGRQERRGCGKTENEGKNDYRKLFHDMYF